MSCRFESYHRYQVLKEKARLMSGLFFCVDGALLALGMIAYQTVFLAQLLPEEFNPSKEKCTMTRVFIRALS